MKPRDLLLCCLVLLLPSPGRATSEYDKITRLAAECRAGQDKSCSKVLRTAGGRTDAALLARIARTSKDAFLRAIVAGNPNLTDQAVLAEIARTDEAESVRVTAVERVTDEAVLAEIARTDKAESVRVAAVKNPHLSDQTRLAEMATQSGEWTIRSEAVRKVRDQSFLAQKAIEDEDIRVRTSAVENLEDPALVEKVAYSQRKGRAAPTLDPVESIARMKLAIQEPRVKLRFPRLRCAVSMIATGQSYLPNQMGIHAFGGLASYMAGHSITIGLYQDDTLVRGSTWQTAFPREVTRLGAARGRDLGFQSAQVRIGDLLKSFFSPSPTGGNRTSESHFTQEDLAELTRSGIYEVRIAAVGSLTDPAVLDEIARTDADTSLREAAAGRLQELSRK